ncbi:MAG: hypothetical protein KIT34_03535 [Cyanobacteria bacterium TGS_CYA1]|nr:hypothetical protein [Cyanobacteria bacterium TGS_CYA1]
MTNILFCYSNTGGGHKSATKAIVAAINEVWNDKTGQPPPNIVLEDIIENSNVLNSFFVFFYNFLLRHKQDWVKYYYNFIEWSKPNSSDFGYALCSGYIKKVLRKSKPDVIVSVHPMVNHYVARCLKEMGMTNTKLLVVVTDPNGKFWTGWACDDADLTIAPNDLAKQRLINLGLPENKIKVIGMPVEPVYTRPSSKSRQAWLAEVGLQSTMLTVCLTGGSAGGGKIIDIYRSLKKCSRKIQVVVLCGKNQKLLEQMQEERKLSSHPTAVLLYANSMSDVMNGCDLLITKCGGLTTFEAIARRIPMAIDMITEPMPQEEDTARMLIETGLASPIEKPDDIIAIVDAMEFNLNASYKPLPTQHNLDRTNAVFEIADEIIAFR